ncbi:MAG: DUF4446 family protein [Fimbriimonas sp.]|nr:DUF4446 family protein [Fimbriimonas sp.]
MDVVLKILTQHTSEILLFLLVAVLALAILVVRSMRLQSSSQSRWRSLLPDGRGETLETMLYDHLRERMRIEQELEALRTRAQDIEARLTESKRHLGLVRYDAFDDVRGNQSFAMAIYDDQGNGAVLNSIVGRADCRVYCKPLLNGRSERDLSQEEQRAIREARATGPKTIISL